MGEGTEQGGDGRKMEEEALIRRQRGMMLAQVALFGATQKKEKEEQVL